jgi:hypothetical protein
VTWFYTAPASITLPLFVILFIAGQCAIVIALRPVVRRYLVESDQSDRVLGYVFGTFGVFFGILLGLVAVSVYGNYTDAHSASLEETSRLGALYRGVSNLPEPDSSILMKDLRAYVHTVIDEDWPAQAHDQVPSASRADVDTIESQLYRFDPRTRQEQVQYQQLLSTFDSFIEARRARLDSTTIQLPPVFWLVIWTGALVNAVLIGLIEVRSLRLHLVMAGLLSLFVGMVMYVTAQMDHPYAGTIAVSAGDFIRLLQQWDQ